MRKVITYGTFDLLHTGHLNLLKKAKELGDYLIVGVTTEHYDNSRGKLNVQHSLMKRIKSVRDTGIANEIIIEEFEGQKIQDILKYEVDVFTIGSDWEGKFDYLKDYCEVTYLPRTKGISSTKLRETRNSVIKLGVVGSGRYANRFIPESKYVSGVNVEGVFGSELETAKSFAEKHQLNFYSINYDEFLQKIDAVYIASPHLSHYEYAKKALLNNKNVLSEKPLVLSKIQATELFELAKSKNLVLMEGIKTAYSPGFIRLVSLAKSGVIGRVKAVDATFTKLVDENKRELDFNSIGGSVSELATYPLLAIVKFLGEDMKCVQFYSHFHEQKNIDTYTKINVVYNDSIGTANIGLGVKSEGSLVVSGTNGYIYVPAPWWKTEYFEVRYENSNCNKKYYYKFEEDGLRYEIAEFISLINNNKVESYKLPHSESIKIVETIERFILGENIIRF